MTTPLLLITVASTANAQETHRLRVSVTFASGRGVFLDQGRTAGVAVGLRVQLYPPGSGSIEATIRAVSSHSALADLPEGIPLPPVGTKGEIEIEGPLPEQTPQEKPQLDTTDPQRAAPQHPPWSRKEEKLGPDTQLLAPAFGQTAKDRPIKFKGRLFSQLLYTADRGQNRDNDNTLARVGTWIEATNLFGRGGRTLFSGEANVRGADLLEDLSDNKFRINRLSYAIGGKEYSRFRLEFGRFFSPFLPELGLVDGAEAVVKLRKGFQIGMGLGFHPESLPLNVSNEDGGLHLFADYQSDAWHHLSTVLAYQKTWHKGEPDRDLFLGRLNLKPTEKIWFYTSWKVDIYTSGDSIKNSVLDLTEFWAQFRYTPDRKKGAAISITHNAWPELKRREFRDLPVDLVKNGKVDRLNVSGWFRPRDRLRLSARFDAWEDQNDHGTGGELSADLTGTPGGPSLHSAAYYTDGSFNNGMGFRVQARQGVGGANGSVGYELFRYTNVGSIGSEEEAFIRHTVRGGFDWNINKWNYSLTFAARGCAGCHEDTHQGKLGRNCTDCHNEENWLPKNAIARHNQTRFPLIGAHAATGCYRCHPGAEVGNFAGIDPSCVACHSEDLTRAKAPDHFAQGLTDNCQQCHLSVSWIPAKFDPPGAFPLTGGHATQACTDCHQGGIYTGLSTDCVSCHQPDYQLTTNLNHAAAGFSTSCTQCHNTTTWQGAVFNHPASFPLSGGHAGPICTDCHQGNVFAGLSSDCVTCHLSDYQQTTNPNHPAAGFSTTCTICHNTTTWQGAVFNHSFPINSGAHKKIDCIDCHLNPSNQQQFSCTHCHDHRKSKMDDKHKEENGYVWSSPACLSCHPQGKH